MKLSIFLLFFLIFEQVFCCNSLLLDINMYTDTITMNMSIEDDGTLLLSTGRTYALGFFSPGKSTNRYIGIWYNVSKETIVWVANRDTPVHDSSGVLSLDRKGNLVIRSGLNLSNRIWSTNITTTTSGNRFSCQLLDTGNLKLIHDNTVVWQSFDHPTNTMLPLMKLGLDRNTGLNWFLTSWKSEDDPGTGEFSYQMDITELPELIVKQGPNRLWRSGPWNGQGWMGSSQNLSNQFVTTNFTNNRDEVSVMYAIADPSTWKLRVVLNESGGVQRLSWNSASRTWYMLPTLTDQCDHYSSCGSYGNCDTTSSSLKCTCLPGFEPNWNKSGGLDGCVRKKGQSICGKGDGFVKVEHVKSPDTRMAHLNMTTGGLEACRQQCLDNCTCTAYASAGDQDLCITWHGELLDTRLVPSRGQDLYVRVGDIESGNGRSKKVVYIIVASIAAAALALGAIIIWFMTIKIKKDRTRKEHQMLLNNTANGSLLEVSTTEKVVFDDDFPSFDLNTILVATDNFSISNKLGEGGFGTVYKGHLRNGLEIAVKRLAKSSDQGMEEFMNEVTLIAKLQHRNLVRLLGCCVQPNEKMLIYEYLPNKGLDSFIFDEEKCSMLNWERRFNIILGITRGMIYLHQDSRLRIIHRDLKASNILLDHELNPKISDFGMARIFRGDEMEVITKRVVGTYGYMSPEYAMDGLFSTKSDVFSFGVLLLEILSGRRNSNYYRYNNINLIGHTWTLWKEGKTFEIIDPGMGDSCPKEEAMRCFHIGLLCVQELPMDRPSMSNIASMLCNEIPLPLPKQPAFTFKRQEIDASDSSASATARSISDHLTISQVVGR